MLAAVAVLTNLAFSVGYDAELRCPLWVQYDLEPHEVIATNRAPVQFRADPRVPESDVGADYAGSRYDRGHMAPAADFNFDADALGETYLLTNICPQDPALNRGAWAAIEREVRTLAASGTVHVLTLPLFFSDDTPSVKRYAGRVRVPDGFDKIAWGWFGVRRWRVGNCK